MENAYLNWVRNGITATALGMAFVHFRVTTDDAEFSLGGAVLQTMGAAYVVIGAASCVSSAFFLRRELALTAFSAAVRVQRGVAAGDVRDGHGVPAGLAPRVAADAARGERASPARAVAGPVRERGGRKGEKARLEGRRARAARAKREKDPRDVVGRELESTRIDKYKRDMSI